MSLRVRGKMMKTVLIPTCDVALACECGSKSFRIFMETNEDTDEMSEVRINNVECDQCHKLFQLEYVP
jgi:hypothetical protein